MRLVPKFIVRWFERFVDRLAHRAASILMPALADKYHRILTAVHTEGGYAVTAYTDAKEILTRLAAHIAAQAAGVEKQVADAVASAVAGKDQVIAELNGDIEDLKLQLATIDATFAPTVFDPPATTPENTPVIPTGEGDETTHVDEPAPLPEAVAA